MYTAKIIHIAVIALLLGGVLAACDNPVEDDGDEHPGEEAEGLLLLSGGQELVRVEGGETSDTLFVPLDESTGEIEVDFLNESGDVFHGEDLEEGLTLALEIRGEEIVTVQPEGAWDFRLRGDAAGETAIRILLMHEGHPDFTTPDIAVIVE